MTLEEAIKLLKQYQGYDPMFPDGETLKHAFDLTDETVDTLLSALRPVSRERAEKVWPECDYCEIPCDNCKSAYKWDTHGLADECVVCRENGYKNYTPESQFCEFCGRPLTDEAVEMVMERLEALYEKA